jgi:hypothetical protein
MRKWSRDNLDSQQQAFALKGLLADSSASTIFCNYNHDDDISVKTMPTNTNSVSSPMPMETPSNIYCDQLSALSHGIALWNSGLPKIIYNNVSIGDVGYLQEGTFIRMFNVMLPWDDPSNRLFGDPEPYESLDCGPFNILEGDFDRVDYYSRYVSAETNAGDMHASSPEQ